MASPESERVFKDGRALLKAGKIAEACDAFVRSQELEASPGTLLNLADCREQQGKTATALNLFLEAAQLATTKNKQDFKVEAERRAKLVKAKLAYITITVAPERQVAGLVIKRNGLAVDRAMWNTPVALDPGDYVVEVSAPRYKVWSSAPQRLGPATKLGVVVEALVLEATAEPPPGPASGPGVGPAIETPVKPPDVVAAVPPRPAVRLLSVGLLIGGRRSAPDPEVSDNAIDQDVLYGARISAGIPASHGALRAIASVLSYGSFLDNPKNNTNTSTSYLVGISADYVWMPRPQLGFGVGLGGGVDLLRRYSAEKVFLRTDTDAFWTLRASPIIVRFMKGQIEAGLHLQYLHADRGATFALVAIDFFPL
ncbi:MAG: tetratricopeptide repeat protein [Kofleriaceae bacterium]